MKITSNSILTLIGILIAGLMITFNEIRKKREESTDTKTDKIINTDN